MTSTSPRFARFAGLLMAPLLVFGALAPSASADPEVIGLFPLEREFDEAFGEVVSVSGDLMLVGAPGQQAAFVFGRTNGRWVQRQRIASSSESYDGFGASVAIDGTRALIGAPQAADGDGRTHVWDLDRTRGAWTERQVLSVGSRGDGFAFGQALAIDGDVFAIAATEEGQAEGAVYIFRPTLPDEWVEQKRCVPGDPNVDMRFGTAVALDEGTLVATAPGQDSARGAVYVFDNSGRNWIERLKIGSGAQDPEGLGTDVDLHGDTILVSAAPADRAYVYERRDDGVELLDTLLPTGPAPPETFGASVALGRGTAIVSDPDVFGGTGELSVFVRSGDSYALRTTIVPPNDIRHVMFGRDIAIDEDLVGATSPSSFGGDQAGAYAVDLRERTDGYIAAKSARFVPAPGKKAQPGLTVTGTLDLGPDAADPSQPGTLRIGDATVFFGPLTRTKAKKPFVVDDGTTSLSIKPPANGSSKALFVLRHSDVAATGISPDGVVALSIETTQLSATGSFQLVGGSFKAGKRGTDLTSPLLIVDKLKLKAKGPGKSTFKWNGRYATPSEVPATAPLVKVRLGDDFEEELPASLFKRKKSKWTYKNGKATGITSLVLDYAKGKVIVSAKRLSMVPGPAGPVPVSIGIEVDGVSREANVTAVAKGKSVSY